MTDDFFDHVNAELAVPEPQTVKVDVTVDLAESDYAERPSERMMVPSTGRVFCPACNWKMGSVAGEVRLMKRHLEQIHFVDEETALDLATRLVRCAVWLWLTPKERGTAVWE